jgi:hypothetical protein
LCHHVIGTKKEDSKNGTGRLLARPSPQIKSSQFGLNVDTTGSNQSTDLRQNASLKRCRMTPVSKTQMLFGRDELTHQPRLYCQRADTSQHEIAATTMQIVPYAFSRIRDNLRHSVSQ